MKKCTPQRKTRGLCSFFSFRRGFLAGLLGKAEGEFAERYTVFGEQYLDVGGNW